MPDKLTPNDDRVERASAEVNGRTYTYLLARPEGTPKGHIVLVHGFPDMAFGWRNQIPFLQSLGYAVLTPNMLGYAGTTTPPAGDAAWSYKSIAGDVAALTRAVFGDDVKVIVGGHDWGGLLAWKLELWHPDLLRGVFSVCTPYVPPSPVYFDLETLVGSGRLPNFAYQLQFISGEAAEHIQTPDDVRRALLAIYGARTEDTREPGFTTEKGYLWDRLPRLAARSPLVSDEELDEYVRAYTEDGSGFAGPLRWYGMRKATFEEEKDIAEKGPHRVHVPSLFVQATKDAALPPAMAKGMEKHFDDLKTVTVEASHWALWQTADKVNAYLKEWIADKFEEGAETGSSL